jgi:hypothetical protein
MTKDTFIRRAWPHAAATQCAARPQQGGRRSALRASAPPISLIEDQSCPLSAQPCPRPLRDLRQGCALGRAPRLAESLRGKSESVERNGVSSHLQLRRVHRGSVLSPKRAALPSAAPRPPAGLRVARAPRFASLRGKSHFHRPDGRETFELVRGQIQDLIEEPRRTTK